jgi:hypothetical protein
MKAKGNPMCNLAAIHTSRVLTEFNGTMPSERSNIDSIVSIKIPDVITESLRSVIPLNLSDQFRRNRLRPTAVSTARRHETIDLVLIRLIPTQDRTNLAHAKVVSVNVNMKPARTVNRSTGTHEGTQDRTNLLDTLATGERRRDKFTTVAIVILDATITHNLPIATGIVVIAFILARETRRGDSTSSDVRINADELNLNPETTSRNISEKSHCSILV